eukprot:10299.XXX_23654_24132_1 [CDS] Oithona nana genome sequencing.
MTQNKMENVPGKYKFESQENFDDFLKAQGVGMLKRKAVLNFKPEVTIRVDGTKLTFENTTPLKTTRKTEFNLDEAFEVDLMGLADKQTHINSFSGNVLTTKDVGSDKVVATRTFNADGFVMKMFGPNDVTAVRHFKRV